MKKLFGLLLAALLLLIPLAAFAEGEEGTPPPDAVQIAPAGDSDTYKELLMDSFDQTQERESQKAALERAAQRCDHGHGGEL